MSLKFFNDLRFSDCVILVQVHGDPSTVRQYHLSKLRLAERSSFFEARFTTVIQVREDVLIELETLELLDQFEAVLKFLYHDTLDPVLPIHLTLADRYGIPSLMTAAIDSMLSECLDFRRLTDLWYLPFLSYDPRILIIPTSPYPDLTDLFETHRDQLQRKLVDVSYAYNKVYLRTLGFRPFYAWLSNPRLVLAEEADVLQLVKFWLELHPQTSQPEQELLIQQIRFPLIHPDILSSLLLQDHESLEDLIKPRLHEAIAYALQSHPMKLRTVQYPRELQYTPRPGQEERTRYRHMLSDGETDQFQIHGQNLLYTCKVALGEVVLTISPPIHCQITVSYTSVHGEMIELSGSGPEYRIELENIRRTPRRKFVFHLTYRAIVDNTPAYFL